MNRQAASQTHQEIAAAPLLAGGILQRKCDCGQHTIAGGECSDCQNKQRSLQRSTRSDEVETQNAAGVPRIVQHVLSSPGQHLDASTRAFFEPRFGHDFSRVRVHTDEDAAESARSVNALAYTVGHDLVFGRRQYAPETGVGRRLIAHELTHVVQQGFQGSSSASAVSRLDSISQEREADTIAGAVNSSVTIPDLLFTPGSLKSVVLQRSNGEGRDRSRESRPRDAPRGTRPIDESGLDREDVHKIKDGIGAGPRDWVGITPDGEVITTDGEGNAENHGPASDYLREAHPEVPSWVWSLLVVVGIIVVAGIIACFATGVCEVAAVVAGLGYATALLIMGLLRRAGIRDSGAETAATEPQSESPEEEA